MMALVGREDAPGLDHPAYQPEPRPLDVIRFRPTVGEFVELLERWERDPDGLENYLERKLAAHGWNMGEHRAEVDDLGGGEVEIKVFWR
jgi:hypothetical protein